MASQTRLTETAPTTLPADFDEWDSGEPPATLPDDFDKFDSEPTAARKPAIALAAAPPIVTRMPEPLPVRSAALGKADARDFSGSFPSFRTSLEAEPEPKNKRRMMVIWSAIGVVVVVLLLLAILIPRMNRRPPAATVVVSRSVGTEQPDGAAGGQTAETKPTATLQQPAPTFPAAQRPAVDAETMSRQLNAPSRIPRDIKTPQKDSVPPPSIAAIGLEGLGGNSSAAVGSVFSGQPRPKVKIEIPKMVMISSGVAQGMLIRRAAPVYPAIAKSARVAGTVALQAMISKTGSVEGVHVLGGPEMLRQSAIDAVKGWRYKPFMLDNQPVEVGTTINVIFSLGN